MNRKARIAALGIFLMLVLAPGASKALVLPASAPGVLNLNNIPQPLQDVWSLFSRVTANIQNLPVVSQTAQSIGNGVRGALQDAPGLPTSPQGLLDQINSFVVSKLGISLSEVGRAVGNAVLWVIDIVKGIVTWLLSLIH